jgi:hypothetical protein
MPSLMIRTAMTRLKLMSVNLVDGDFDFSHR